MPLALQMLNIGSEISRANRWKSKGYQNQVERAVFRALEMIRRLSGLDKSHDHNAKKQNKKHQQTELAAED